MTYVQNGQTFLDQRLIFLRSRVVYVKNSSKNIGVSKLEGTATHETNILIRDTSILHRPIAEVDCGCGRKYSQRVPYFIMGRSSDVAADLNCPQCQTVLTLTYDIYKT